MHLLFSFFHIVSFAAIDLANDYLDLRSTRREFIETRRTGVPVFHMSRFINVTFPGGMASQTRVSEMDYDRILALSNSWRVNNKGYVVWNSRPGNGKYRCVYMHREIFGRECMHINGDLLDNRRENLQIPFHKRRLEPGEEEPGFKIHRCVEDSLELDSVKDEEVIRYFVGHVNITYPDDKVYSGEIEAGRPHGYGILVEKRDKKTTLGIWRRGLIYCGVVFRHAETVMLPASFSAIDDMRLIQKGKLVDSSSSRDASPERG